MDYKARILDQELKLRLESAGAVVIEGAKACGKTETAKRIAASIVLLDIDIEAREALAVEPSLVLQGATPRLLDEWQMAPELWNHVRRAVDSRKAKGQFILTGSSVPNDDADRHTGAGRFSFLRLRPMSLYESGHSTNQVSLAHIMEGESVRAADPGLSVSDLSEILTRGGWPGQQDNSVSAAAQASRDYLSQVQAVDVGRVAGPRRDPAKIGQLLKSLARNVATEVPATKLALDAGGADGPLSRITVDDYLNALDRLMVLENQPSWAPHLRSKAILRSSPKRHFVDPSLAVAGLGAGPELLMKDLRLMGFLFESLVVRDLRILSQPLGGVVSHYRDSSGLEVDAIVQLNDGRWAAFEVKLGSGRIEEAAGSLSRFASKVDFDRMGEPVALVVVTGTGYSYVRPDGIMVVAAGALGL